MKLILSPRLKGHFATMKIMLVLAIDISMVDIATTAWLARSGGVLLFGDNTAKMARESNSNRSYIEVRLMLY